MMMNLWEILAHLGVKIRHRAAQFILQLTTSTRMSIISTKPRRDKSVPKNTKATKKGKQNSKPHQKKKSADNEQLVNLEKSLQEFVSCRI